MASSIFFLGKGWQVPASKKIGCLYFNFCFLTVLAGSVFTSFVFNVCYTKLLTLNLGMKNNNSKPISQTRPSWRDSCESFDQLVEIFFYGRNVGATSVVVVVSSVDVGGALGKNPINP